MDKELKQLVKEAKKAKACEEELDKVMQYDTVRAALASPSGPYWAFWYAFNIIKGRWSKGEAAIATDPEWAFWYAFNIIKGRWSKGEAAIAKAPQWSYWYACDVIGGRWPEVEAGKENQNG